MALVPSSSHGGAAATAVTARQQLGGGSVTIANGGNDRLPWSSSFGPNVLLDRSVNDIPAVLSDGIYAVTVIVVPTALSVDGTYQVELELDSDGEIPVARMDSTPGSAALPTPFVCVSLTYYMAAGGTLRVVVRNHDGTSARGFNIEGAVVQRVT